MAKGKKGKPAAPSNETKKQRFSRVVTPRVRKAVEAIKLIGNCAGPSYEYTEDQVTKIQTLLEEAFNGMLAKFGGEGAEEAAEESLI